MVCCSSARYTIVGVALLHVFGSLGCIGLWSYLLTLEGESLQRAAGESWSLMTSLHLPVVVEAEVGQENEEKVDEVSVEGAGLERIHMKVAEAGMNLEENIKVEEENIESETVHASLEGAENQESNLEQVGSEVEKPNLQEEKQIAIPTLIEDSLDEEQIILKQENSTDVENEVLKEEEEEKEEQEHINNSEEMDNDTRNFLDVNEGESQKNDSITGDLPDILKVDISGSELGDSTDESIAIEKNEVLKEEETVEPETDDSIIVTEETIDSEGSVVLKKESVAPEADDLIISTEESADSEGSEVLNEEESVAPKIDDLIISTDESADSEGSEIFNEEESVAPKIDDLIISTDESADYEDREVLKQEETVAPETSNKITTTEQHKHISETDKETINAAQLEPRDKQPSTQEEIDSVTEAPIEHETSTVNNESPDSQEDSTSLEEEFLIVVQHSTTRETTTKNVTDGGSNEIGSNSVLYVDIPSSTLTEIFVDDGSGSGEGETESDRLSIDPAHRTINHFGGRDVESSGDGDDSEDDALLNFDMKDFSKMKVDDGSGDVENQVESSLKTSPDTDDYVDETSSGDVEISTAPTSSITRTAPRDESKNSRRKRQLDYTSDAELHPTPVSMKLDDRNRYSLLDTNSSNDIEDDNRTVETMTIPPLMTTTGFISTILTETMKDSQAYEKDSELHGTMTQLSLSFIVLGLLLFSCICCFTALLLIIAAIMSQRCLVVPWLVVQWLTIMAATTGVGLLTWRLVVAEVLLFCWWLLVLAVAGVVVLILCLVLVLDAYQSIGPSTSLDDELGPSSFEMEYMTGKSHRYT